MPTFMIKIVSVQLLGWRTFCGSTVIQPKLSIFDQFWHDPTLRPYLEEFLKRPRKNFIFSFKDDILLQYIF